MAAGQAPASDAAAAPGTAPSLDAEAAPTRPQGVSLPASCSRNVEASLRLVRHCVWLLRAVGEWQAATAFAAQWSEVLEKDVSVSTFSDDLDLSAASSPRVPEALFGSAPKPVVGQTGASNAEAGDSESVYDALPSFENLDSMSGFEPQSSNNDFFQLAEVVDVTS